jgi:hypothetical protein
MKVVSYNVNLCLDDQYGIGYYELVKYGDPGPYMDMAERVLMNSMVSGTMNFLSMVTPPSWPWLFF